MQAGVQVAQRLLYRVKLAAVTVGGVGGQGGFIKGNPLLLPPFVKLRGDAAGVGRAVGTAGLRIYVGAGAVSARRGQIGQLDQCAAVTIKVKQQLAAVCGKLSRLRLPVCDLGYSGRQPLQFGLQGITVLRIGAGILCRGEFLHAVILPAGCAVSLLCALDSVQEIRAISGCQSVHLLIFHSV